MPKRIQRKRTKGWRMPPNTVYVGRPSQWGNPWAIGEVWTNKARHSWNPYCGTAAKMAITSDNVLQMFRIYASRELSLRIDWLEPLRGKDLACWCKEGSPCHADILLELANERKASDEPRTNGAPK